MLAEKLGRAPANQPTSHGDKQSSSQADQWSSSQLGAIKSGRPTGALAGSRDKENHPLHPEVQELILEGAHSANSEDAQALLLSQEGGLLAGSEESQQQTGTEGGQQASAEGTHQQISNTEGAQQQLPSSDVGQQQQANNDGGQQDTVRMVPMLTGLPQLPAPGLVQQPSPDTAPRPNPVGGALPSTGSTNPSSIKVLPPNTNPEGTHSSNEGADKITHEDDNKLTPAEMTAAELTPAEGADQPPATDDDKIQDQGLPMGTGDIGQRYS